ncbi:hypothetical protein Cni_G01052 [Canna indica]|uniref:Pentatricopeptide repeat-containing protein n=1 Tax=Canna indica TaxID=4628 RepID=A0AAQ3JLU1_9LILI|nr:hypothetical protein Cni_G01052 [Canna indica]
MAVLATPSASLSFALSGHNPSTPDNEAIRQRLLRKGVSPTPRILHNLRKKEAQKVVRRTKKRALREQPPPLSESQRQELEEDDLFRTVRAEYRAVREDLRRRGEREVVLSGRPWEGSKAVDLSNLKSAREDPVEGRLKTEELEELRRTFAERVEQFRWLLVNDEVEDTGEFIDKQKRKPPKSRPMIGDEEKIRMLVDRLSNSNLSVRDWKFSRIMKQSDLLFTEMYMIKIVERLGILGNWSQTMSVVEWVYNENSYKHRKSRFVYTKLLFVLGKAKRPIEALHVFNKMREDGQLYPDMAAYHCIAGILGQAGLVNELINIIECMKQKPSRKLRNMNRSNWDPCLEPDVSIYNAVLNACGPSHQWKGVSWVLQQMRHNGLKPNAATYGLAMEVMLKAGKYDLVHKYFEMMQKGGMHPNALTYRDLVKAFSAEGRVDEAVEAVREMEQRGVVGAASVYYELACCLCNKGRWQDAMFEVAKLKRLTLTKPLEVAFTGMILSSFYGGYFADCISIFEHMKDHCTPNIGTINVMLKVYSCGDMFAKAKELFEATKANSIDGSSLQLDAYSYRSMLEACACAQQWEYFEYVYKQMILSGFQLDRRFSWLLVKASRAGKWHLLEHAFDTILEAGDIPPVSLFTAMICQTIVQQDFQRTASLLNGMAHASLAVSESKWTNLLLREMDRFSVENLQDLLHHLESCNLVMEDPVPNFLNSLRSVCEGRLLENSSTSAHVYVDSVDNEDEDASDSSRKKQNYLYDILPPEIDGGLSSNSPDAFSSRNGVEAINEGRYIDDSSRLKVNHEASRLPAGADDDVEPSLIDSVLDSLTANVGRPFSRLPSASEILEKWKHGMIEDRILHS